MKRIIPIALLMLLCALPARAETWFPDGWTLHRDPICVYRSLSLESCFEPTLVLTKEEAAAQGYPICTLCCAVNAESTVDAAVTWYSNPDGGSFLHRDPDCPSVSDNYKPTTSAAQLPQGELPENPCNYCGHAAQVEFLFDNTVWNATPAERAALLPGVWTVPSENAISADQAARIAENIAAAYSNKTVHSVLPLHYGRDAQGNPRETWQVVVATTLQHPVCVVYLDALTGECLSASLSREYSEKMELRNYEQLCLAVAEGTQIEILANQVNFRNKPNGATITDSIVITRFDKGDTLPLLGEQLNGDKLWYYVSSAKHGEGYISADFAQIVHNGQRAGKPMTDNLIAYLTELRRWQIENGFLALDDSGTYAYTRDASLNTEPYREELVSLMQKYSITATVGGSASAILANHYGTPELWKIFVPTLEILPHLQDADWHARRQPTVEEAQRLTDALAAVDAAFR